MPLFHVRCGRGVPIFHACRECLNLYMHHSHTHPHLTWSAISRATCQCLKRHPHVHALSTPTLSYHVIVCSGLHTQLAKVHLKSLVDDKPQSKHLLTLMLSSWSRKKNPRSVVNAERAWTIVRGSKLWRRRLYLQIQGRSRRDCPKRMINFDRNVWWLGSGEHLHRPSRLRHLR